MKPEKASLHAPKVRFMAHSAASYILMLDEQSSQAQNVLHKNAFSDEAAPVFISLRRGKPFHSAMKHCSAAAPQYEAFASLI